MSAMGYIPILLAPLVLAMWALAVFLVVKFFAICAEKFYAATTGKALSSERCNLLVAVTCLAITFIAPVWVFKNIQVKGYEAAIPQALQITDLIYNSEQGLHESCGAAVFKLSPSTVSSINTQGLVFFKTAVVGRGNRAYHLYAPWQSTSPYNPAETPLLRGSPCLIDPPEIWHSIQRATRAKGAFFTVGSEYDLVVIPTLGVVVFSFNG